MEKLNWLVVAPRHDDLKSVEAELAAISSHHNIVPQPPLLGYVTDLDIAQTVGSIDCDVFCWSTHAEADGIKLSDGHILDADTVAQFVRVSGAALCIFNVCLGETFAQRVAYLCACDVIYTPIIIRDRLAAIYIGQYAAALAEHNDYHAAYKAVGSHGGDYKYIRASDSVTRGRADTTETIASLRNQNAQIKASLTTLAITFFLIAAIAIWFAIVLSGISERQNEMQKQQNDIQNQIIELKLDIKYMQRQIDAQGRNSTGETAEVRQ